ncbi:hypothetical protein DV096_20355 [Bradymonadaceae bacterium TMQ3]|uniref:Uncharacterized protein n=1 Tax=Lujinxingia sediminis TaxID=2480984 RepID=A0ABY0CMY4_9DELT|nr:hypothetical protein [Lujinxingia sediminis]RDV36196.1 hypothetical protein DV096_20355 [Bradymonadaceae bacterium TMQ3]RVU41016.1 hypothetical protein EA187_19135 [Lujinxingia sediminis]TXC67660.1 hypothetical protein FRC91_20025 [Bradymonadales bacterium TMQ1]
MRSRPKSQPKKFLDKDDPEYKRGMRHYSIIIFIVGGIGVVLLSFFIARAESNGAAPIVDAKVRRVVAE